MKRNKYKFTYKTKEEIIDCLKQNYTVSNSQTCKVFLSYTDYNNNICILIKRHKTHGTKDEAYMLTDDIDFILNHYFEKQYDKYEVELL